jgi:CRP/FNR family transcriptional regulator
MNRSLAPELMDGSTIDHREFLNASATTTILLKSGTSFLQRSPLFEGLTEEECRSVAHCSELREYRRGEVIFQNGDPACSVLMLVFGKVKIAQSSRNGKEVILRMDGRGDLLTFPGVQRGLAHTYSAMGIETSHVLTWDAADFEELQHSIPRIQSNGVAILRQRMLQLETSFLELATEAVAQRLSRLLLRIAEGQDTAISKVNMTNEQMASMIGATLFTVNRLLAEWMTSGIVERHRCSVTILSRNALEAVANETLE